MASESNKRKIYPVILSGGAGSRLWPLSRKIYPKQLLPLCSDDTMVQDTAKRVGGEAFASPLVICNDEHRFIMAEQLRAIGIEDSDIILEPVGRNTAPAAAIAAMAVQAKAAAAADDEPLVLLMPSDHYIADQEAFLNAVNIAAEMARAGNMVTFGVVPTAPETGYGYIHRGAAINDSRQAYKIDTFVEKPDLATAEDYLKQGGYYWNSGMFVFPARLFLEELKRLQPDILDWSEKAFEQAEQDLTFRRLEAEYFSNSPSISIDYAVMEHVDCGVVVPLDAGWSDVGAWSSLWENKPKDAEGNVFEGDVIAEGVRQSYVYSPKELTAVVGLEDTIVVVTDDAILVSSKDKVQDVKLIVDRLEETGRHEHINHLKVYRPWGNYRTIGLGPRYQVKEIVVKPGSILSLQMHHHRAEHWVVVEGTALVTRDDKEFLLHENESTYIPIGIKHRLENPGKVPLKIIEVQSGEYLGEDDIVRFDDTYGRH